jgi:hypothetical protein
VVIRLLVPYLYSYLQVSCSMRPLLFLRFRVLPINLVNMLEISQGNNTRMKYWIELNFICAPLIQPYARMSSFRNWIKFNWFHK